jgi:hypothetical protein
MKSRVLSFLVLFMVIGSMTLWAQGGGRIEGKLNVGVAPLSQGNIKVGEKLTTQDGIEIPPGTYRISVALNSLNEASFVISPFKVKQPDSAPALTKNAMNTQKTKDEPSLFISAKVSKNLLVKGIASNIEGIFVINNITPTEAQLNFMSKQFDAVALLGRSLDSKLVDLVPSFISIDQTTDCGADCIEGVVKVTIRNDGNTDASGKWNVTIVDPHLFVGTIADIPAGGEKTVVSTAKVKLPCCNPVNLDAEVHADFYNKVGVDSNDSNNTKRFTIKFKQ